MAVVFRTTPCSQNLHSLLSGVSMDDINRFLLENGISLPAKVLSSSNPPDVSRANWSLALLCHDAGIRSTVAPGVSVGSASTQLYDASAARSFAELRTAQQVQQAHRHRILEILPLPCRESMSQGAIRPTMQAHVDAMAITVAPRERVAL